MLDHWNNSSWVYMSLNCVLNAKAANMNVIFFWFTRLGLNQPHYHTPHGQFTYHHYTTEEPVLTFHFFFFFFFFLCGSCTLYSSIVVSFWFPYQFCCLVYSDCDYTVPSYLLKFNLTHSSFKRNLLHIILLLMYCNLLNFHHVNNTYYVQFIT
jgi:hypothetical protein